MKNFFTLSAALLLALSCGREEYTTGQVTTDSDGGSLTIDFTISRDGATKSMAGQGQEDAINDIQAFLFKSDGTLYRYHPFTQEDISNRYATLRNVNTGTYNLYIFANAPLLNQIKTENELNCQRVELGTYNRPESGFIMSSTPTAVTVMEHDTTAADIPLSRLVGRVTLSSVKNGLSPAFGAMTLNYALMENVCGETFLVSGTDTTFINETWYNKEGRADEAERISSHIIGTGNYTASCPDITFKSIGQSLGIGESYSTILPFYGYSNASSARPSGFHPDFSAQQSALVLSATFDGKTFYYPVVLTEYGRNTSYDVKVTIIGEGSTDPARPVVKGALKAAITITDWITGKTYNETI